MSWNEGGGIWRVYSYSDVHDESWLYSDTQHRMNEVGVNRLALPRFLCVCYREVSTFLLTRF